MNWPRQKTQEKTMMCCGNIHVSLVTSPTYYQCLVDCGGGQGGGSPGEQGAGGVRETGEERAGSGISTMAGSGREIPKGKLSLIVTAHHPVKENNSTTFLDFHLTFSAALNQNFNARKVKKRNFALGIEKRALLLVKLETFPSRLHHRSRVLMNEVA